MSDLVEFRHLKYIAAVAETCNFTRAAERLFLAQPSLSKQIKELEDAIGIQIFIRSRDGVTVTPAGRMIVSYAQQAVILRNEVIKTARAVHRGEVPVLRIGFCSFVNPETLHSLRDAYADLFPECPMRLWGGNPSQILQRMEQGTLDGALLPMPIGGDDLIVEHIASDALVVCMRVDDPLTLQTQIQPAELSQKLKIFRDPETHPAAHDRLMEMFAETGIQPQVSYLAATPADIQWMVEEDCGLALIDRSITLSPSLTTRPIAGAEWTADSAFVYRKDAAHQALPTLIRHLRKAKNKKSARLIPHRKEAKEVQLKLLA
jgi:DNA-binding transcriptional LysR family regulator